MGQRYFARSPAAALRHAVGLFIQPHFICNHGDELGVGGLAAQVMDGVAEITVQGVYIAAVPRYLNGVADGALYPAGRGAVVFGYFGVQAFGDRIDVLAVLHCHPLSSKWHRAGTGSP